VFVHLADLAATAYNREVTLRARAYDVAAARAELLDARAVFDPSLQMRADASASDVASLTTGGRLGQHVAGRTLTSELVGNTPWSTQYGVSVQSAYRRQNPVTTQLNSNEYDNLVSFGLVQPLLRGFGAAGGQAQVNAARVNLHSTEAQFRRFAELTIGDMERLYWVLAQRQEEESVAEESLRRAETLLRRNVELRKLDKVTENDLITARLGVAERRNALVQAVQNREDAGEALIFFAYGEQARDELRRGERVVRAADRPTVPADIPSAAQAESLALAARNDLAAARLTLENDRILRSLSRNALLPALDLTAGYSTLVNNASSLRFSAARLGDIESNGWNMGLSVHVPVANSSARAAVQLRDALYERQEIAITGLENQVRGDVRQAVRAIETGGRVLALADSAVALGRQQYAMETQRLELGLSESFRLLQQEEQIARAQFAQIAARYGLAQAVTRYELAVGRDMLRKYQLSDAPFHH
jgi:outer membrane protein TolC